MFEKYLDISFFKEEVVEQARVKNKKKPSIYKPDSQTNTLPITESIDTRFYEFDEFARLSIQTISLQRPKIKMSQPPAGQQNQQQIVVSPPLVLVAQNI